MEKLLDEKRNFDVAVKFEKLGVEDSNESWTKNGMPCLKKMARKGRRC